jgi:hypothetical protein
MHPTDAILTASKKNAIDMIKDNLAVNDTWVKRAILVVFAAQTASEQCSETTREHNGVGFNGTDAQILSSFAKQIIDFEAGRSKFRSPLSPKQMVIARNKIRKYAGQILVAMRAKAEAEQKKAEVIHREGWDVLLVN